MRVTIYKGENSEQLAHGGYAAVTLPEVEPRPLDRDSDATTSHA